MIVFLLQSKSLGYVEDAFVGNGDELTPSQEKSLRARASKLGFNLVRRAAEPATDLAGYLADLEKEEAKVT